MWLLNDLGGTDGERHMTGTHEMCCFCPNNGTNDLIFFFLLVIFYFFLQNHQLGRSDV